MPMTHAQRRKRREKIIEYLQTHSIQQAVDKFGLSHEYIMRIQKAAGVGRSLSRGRPSHVCTFKVLKMLLDGTRPCDIARTYGIKPQSVQHVKKRAINAGFVLPDPLPEPTQEP